MTVNGRKYSLPTRIKDIMRFQETFPLPNNINNESYPSKRGAGSRSLTPSPKENRRRSLQQQCSSMGQIEAISEDENSGVGVYLFRSNSWSGSRGLRPHLNHLTVRSMADSHRSSTVSLPDVIEEDSSEEEFPELEPIRDDFHIKCYNCRLGNISSSSLDSISSSSTDIVVTDMSFSSTTEMSSCYNCRHLKHNNRLNNNKSQLCVPQSINTNNNNDNNGRRLPWTCHDAPYSPRATRKNSNNGVELPIISEPPCVEETEDTQMNNEGIQKLVKEEVDKLLKFNTKVDSHQQQVNKTLVTLEFFQ